MVKTDPTQCYRTRVERYGVPSMRQFFADTFALIVFSTVAGIVVEFFIAGLTPSQVLQARLAAIPVIVITARPYGIYRDWLFALFNAPAGIPAKKAAVDIIAFVSFQVPIYFAILAFAGATSSVSHYRFDGLGSSLWAVSRVVPEIVPY